YLSSISKDGATNWDFDFGNEIPQIMAIGPSGNIYITSSTKGDIVSAYLYSISQNGESNWKVLLGIGSQLEITGRGGLLIGEDETIYKSGDLKSLLAFNPADGLAKWFKEGIGYGNVDFVDGQGHIYYLNSDKGNKEEIFDQDGNFISSIGPQGGFSLWSLINGNYFYNLNSNNFFIYQALGSGYSKSAWPMRYHDPQNTNRWNGGF
ncbi:MAG: hypothetical protein PHE84_16200, partial [bacterium]|nr:hypothetical protein [bacterium]